LPPAGGVAYRHAVKKKVFLWIIVGTIVVIGYYTCLFAYSVFRSASMPGLVYVKEADFIRLLQSHQVIIRATVESSGPGMDSYSVLWSYKNPPPPDNAIQCATDWVQGSPDDLKALLKKYKDNFPPLPRPKPAMAVRLVRYIPLMLFLLTGGVVFRREMSSVFGRIV